MKSLGLGLVIFGLTGALAVLDMSGAHRVVTVNQEAALPAAKASAQRTIMLSNPNSIAVANADADDADQEVNGVVIETFLVLPRVPLQAGKKSAVALRYD